MWEHGAELEPLRFEPAGPQAPGVLSRVRAGYHVVGALRSPLPYAAEGSLPGV